MDSKIFQNKEYKNWISELSKRYRSAQIKAAVAVNKEMLQFYWELGKEIVERQWENQYGKGFFKQLSKDLKEALPEAKGLSVNNLYYIRQFYVMYSEKSQQIVGKLGLNKFSEEVIKSQQIVGKCDDDEKWQNFVANLFAVPWGHHVLIINKFFKDPKTALFYINETVKHGWSRAVLDHMIDSGLHLRQGKAITNFRNTLPAATSDLAQELTKDPYIFDFTDLTVPFKERELKDELLKSITNFLLELGEGFAYVGKEYRLTVNNKEFYIDLLFYHLKLRSYFVLEVKVTDFQPEHVGQLNFYVTAVDNLLKTEHDNPTIGLIICKTKDNVIAKYTLEGIQTPIGVSEFQLEKFIPENFKSALPSIEEIEAKMAEIKMD